MSTNSRWEIYATHDPAVLNVKFLASAFTLSDIGTFEVVVYEYDIADYSIWTYRGIFFEVVPCVSNVSFDTSPIYGNPTFRYVIGSSDDLVINFSGLTNGNCRFELENYDLTTDNTTPQNTGSFFTTTAAVYSEDPDNSYKVTLSSHAYMTVSTSDLNLA